MTDYIMAVRIDHRTKKACDVQNTLTKHGCIIKLRIGSHETIAEGCNTKSCMEDGIIILYLKTDHEEHITNLENDLSIIDGVTVKKLTI